MPSRRSITKLAAAVAATGLLATAPGAQAGTYKVYSCKTPTGDVAPTDGWTSTGGGTAFSTVSNECSIGGPLKAQINGDYTQPVGARLAWRFSTPPSVTLQGFRAWRSMSTTGAEEVGASSAAYLSWPSIEFADVKESCVAAWGCPSQGTHGSWWSASNEHDVTGLAGIDELYAVAACIGTTGATCADRNSTTPMADMRVHAFEATLEDVSSPVIGAKAGALVESVAHRGTESISFSAGDTGAGIYRGFIEVKRAGESAFAAAVVRVLDDNGGKCADAGADSATDYEFEYRVPCRLSVSTQLDLDTTTLPDGVHELRVRVEDASGNSAVVHGPVAFEVDNVPAPGVSDPDGGGPADGQPSIAGDPVVGNTLVGDRGSWSGSDVSFALQWLRCGSATTIDGCVPIEGATSSVHRLAAEDEGRFVRLRVTASNGQGSSVAVSAAKGPVTAAAAAPAGSGGPSAGERAGTAGHPNNGVNASNRAVLTVTSKRRRTVRFGRRVVATARLRDESGRPISGAQVSVLEQMRVAGASWKPARGPLTTDHAGRLRWVVPAGYGRTIRFAYRANLANADFQATSDLVLVVRSKTTMRASRRFLRNGQRVRFSGRVLSRPIPAGGVLIDLQARVGRRWQTFQTTRATRGGRWASGYRFRSTRGLQTYAFRARVRRDSGFPYAVSRSRTVKVRVAG